MKLEAITVGPLQTNCYIIIAENRESLVIDPGFEAKKIINICKDTKLKYILLTHGHFDHISAVDDLRKAFCCKVVLHAYDKEIYKNAALAAELFSISINEQRLPDILIHGEEAEIEFQLPVKVIHTPGHSSGSVSFIIDNNLFSGDTLFCGSIGRTDLTGSNWKDMQASLRKLTGLSDNLKIYPGHGPSTILGQEKAANPFLQDLI